MRERNRTRESVCFTQSSNDLQKFVFYYFAKYPAATLLRPQYSKSEIDVTVYDKCMSNEKENFLKKFLIVLLINLTSSETRLERISYESSWTLCIKATGGEDVPG